MLSPRIVRFAFDKMKKSAVLAALFLLPFYIVRFIFYSIKERSVWFTRYYPGYHGSTIPSWKYIRNNRHRIIGNRDCCDDGIDLNLEVQKQLMETFCNYYRDFSPSKAPSPKDLYYYKNDKYGFNDAFILYCFLRHYRPRRVIEVGSGFSSGLMLDMAKSTLNETQFTFIDPYSTTIREIINRNPDGNYKLLREEVQNTDLSIYSELKENDILFIDTSHVVKVGSDLSTLLFLILPSLNSGVIIHFHDIWYPLEYPQWMLKEGRGYNEIYFVRAFMQYNKSFEILFFNSYIEQKYKQYLVDKMPGYFKNSGSSLWLRKIDHTVHIH